MSTKLTHKQQIIYDYIKKEIQRNGYAPSVREICDGVGLSSTSTVHAHLEILRKKGYIRRLPSKNRTIEILEEGFYSAHRDYASVLVVKQVPKEGPILHEDNINGKHLVPYSYAGEGECFIYEMEKDNDTEKIKAGDLVLVKIQKSAEVKELVMYHKSNNAAVKKYQESDEGKIVGKVTMIIRRL